MRIAAFPDVAEVCCVMIPVLSFSNIRISPGFILPFSPSSSLEMNSTLVGIFWMLRVPLVDEIITSSSISSSCSKKISTGAVEERGNENDFVSDSYPR